MRLTRVLSKLIGSNLDSISEPFRSLFNILFLLAKSTNFQKKPLLNFKGSYKGLV